MDKLPVGQLPDLQQSNNDDEIMVITNSEYNQLKKEKISDLITDFTSTNENNALTKGTDGKMFVTDFGNASNITEGTLPASVLPDIPKSKLPDIETTDLPNSGVAAGKYIYPTNMQVNNKGQIVSVENGVTADITKEQIDTVAARPLSDNAYTQEQYPDEYSYWVDQTHSTFDLSKFEVVGSPTISDDGIASGFSAKTNFLYKKINLANRNFVLNFDIIASEVVNIECFMSYETNYTTPSTTLFRFQYSSNQRYFVIGSSINTAFLPMDANKKYKFNLQYNVATKIFTLLQYDYNNILINTWGSSPIDFNENGYLIIGNSIEANAGTYCSIDLKSIAVWTDGQPVFSGNKTGIDTINDTLEIPYTETTDGTKVVDAAYYDRVQSCREQTGQALYLTLDEQNQQYYLPQGTVSGMISQNKQKIDELDTTLTADILQAMPVGASIAYEGTTAPDGWFAESGTEIQQSAYPLLYAVVGDKYNLETTQEGYFRLPDTNISSRFYEGSTTPGTLKDAGLPNITATGTGMGVGVISQVGGAAYNSGVNAERLAGGNQDGKRIDFNASRSSSIYGKSTTVQPKSITKFFIIKHD